jgi:L-amino acid N-acyltransferase YncA
MKGTRPSRPRLRPGRRSRRRGCSHTGTSPRTLAGSWAGLPRPLFPGRGVYAGVVEHSVYVDPAARGLGVGRTLLAALISSTEAAGVWTIQSSLFPENTASRALHRSSGFREVGRRERIGQHHGRWRDTILIERRSPAL